MVDLSALGRDSVLWVPLGGKRVVFRIQVRRLCQLLQRLQNPKDVYDAVSTMHKTLVRCSENTTRTRCSEELISQPQNALPIFEGTVAKNLCQGMYAFLQDPTMVSDRLRHLVFVEWPQYAKSLHIADIDILIDASIPLLLSTRNVVLANDL